MALKAKYLKINVIFFPSTLDKVFCTIAIIVYQITLNRQLGLWVLALSCVKLRLVLALSATMGWFYGTSDVIAYNDFI